MESVVDGAFWTCRICTSGGLSPHHACCPNCSHARDWDDVDERAELADPLRFAGQVYTCCGEGWSEAARFCGACGDRLRKRRRGYFGTGEAPRRQHESPVPAERRTLVPFLALDWLDGDDGLMPEGS